jgi:hypothetical protein
LTRPSFARCCSDPFVESSWNCDVLSHVRCHSPMIHTLARALHTAHACNRYSTVTRCLAPGMTTPHEPRAATRARTYSHLKRVSQVVTL